MRFDGVPREQLWSVVILIGPTCLLYVALIWWVRSAGGLAVLGLAGLLVTLGTAFIFNFFAPGTAMFGPDHDPVRTYFVAVVTGVMFPIVAWFKVVRPKLAKKAGEPQ